MISLCSFAQASFAHSQPQLPILYQPLRGHNSNLDGHINHQLEGGFHWVVKRNPRYYLCPLSVMSRGKLGLRTILERLSGGADRVGAC